MNYIGSKHKLTDFIKSTIIDVVGEMKDKIFCDLFAGTGSIGRAFKKESKQIIANDFEYYSFVLNKNYIENHKKNHKWKGILELNDLSGVEGFIYKNYCKGGGTGRQYFSDENGKKIDAIRKEIKKLHESKEISDKQNYYLIASLLESADAVANTASVYGAYLKKLKKSAQKTLKLKSAEFILNNAKHKVYQENANSLIKEIDGDVLYLDPPYNARQYGSNYHLLNTIAEYKEFEPKGKTGLREYQRSLYCQKRSVEVEFENLIKQANFRYIFLSYNNEGLMPVEKVRGIMEKYGDYSLVDKPYQRFKADKTENRNHKATETLEYLHILRK